MENKENRYPNGPYINMKANANPTELTSEINSDNGIN